MRELDSPDDRWARTSATAWFAAILAPMIASQLVRLQQHAALGWIAWDYAGRLGALAVMAAIPSARMVAFTSQRTRISHLETMLWIVGLSLLERLSQAPRIVINAAFPGTVVGRYPQPGGWLYLFDLALGLGLVAVSEELVFRRCAADVLRLWLGNRVLIVLVSSLLFGGYHRWAGLGNVVMATILGAGFMLMLQRSVALWPLVLAHDVVDLIAFA
ncbi:hypothetical protein SSBR45G_61550 [Bradyrhizobium sp. SSBR45G]|uniref:CPBP family intramembrane glutamic endopeptidase n=1 Tax=unclassified Bradyrhizobium TaxID=2631580 RepID=UPI00234290A7|nr:MULTISPECIES: CPBP family intramembrane glutamic endopeptidase [unclassified Bradyrhizobium]GLH81246.1 hypothetical protein SSBR45G_61550 [Bradyrhizobium sp. SSBR45G]GLH88734.1 hypothetical protein SSBR45R_61950 [Bradyrhizobium sp. SSBR45R]